MAARDLGYRRFFDINSLVGLRIENERVFYATHRLVMRWVAEGRLTGLRVDHPDGLRDPLEYFQRLRAACPDTWIVAEKILLGSERLRESWPIEGTTGYDFLNIAGRLFVDPAGAQPLTDFYREFTGESADYAALVRARKQFAMRDTLGSEINTLTAMMLDLCEADRLHRDYTRHEAHEVIRATMACLPIYRTYVREPREVAPEDDCQISTAIEAAKTYRSDLDARLFDFLRDILVATNRRKVGRGVGPSISADFGGGDGKRRRGHRFLFLQPDARAQRSRRRSRLLWRHARGIPRLVPQDASSLAAHDAGDVDPRHQAQRRCAGSAFSSFGGTGAMEPRGNRMGRDERSLIAAASMPDRNFEYHLYQSMVGAWPIEKSRLLAYAEKAAREAKVHTSWTDPVPAVRETRCGNSSKASTTIPTSSRR